MTTPTLTNNDIESFKKSFITPEFAARAGLYRVSSVEGARLIGRKPKADEDFSGIIFPFIHPGESEPHEFRLRRDRPSRELQPDGSTKETGKYLSPPGRGGLLYFVPGTDPDLLTDSSAAVLITEGEKKCLALHRFCSGDGWKALPIGLTGVWNWRGKVGKEAAPNGGTVAIKGPIAALDRITWSNRQVFIIFDSNVKTNESVRFARAGLTKELARRGAVVRWVDLPELPGVNGVDDLLAHPEGGPDLLDHLIETATDPNENSQAKRASKTTRLAEMTSRCEPFMAPDGELYITVPVSNHHETFQVRSTAFRDWLAGEFFRAEGSAPGEDMLRSITNTVAARARFEGRSREVHLRVARFGNIIYLDLGDSTWRVVEISADGWRLIEARSCPVRFRRSGAMAALPIPQPGDIHELRETLGLLDDGTWSLVAAWMTAALCPGAPVPILLLTGEQGSGKSTRARMIRRLLDPNKALLRSAPRDERDLMVAAHNQWCLALDNLSSIPPALSDSLCRLSTGGGFSVRRLHSDNEETVFDALRPLILTGICDVASQPDLLDRLLTIRLPVISEKDRRTETEIWHEFEAASPRLLGALLDCVAISLANWDRVVITSNPRMADFARLATAAEPAFGVGWGTFHAAYNDNRMDANEVAIEAKPISRVLLEMVEEYGDFAMTSQQLLQAIFDRVPEHLHTSHGVPKTPRALVAVLAMIAPNLGRKGVVLDQSKKEWPSRRRLFSFSKNYPLNKEKEPSEASGKANLLQINSLHTEGSRNVESSESSEPSQETLEMKHSEGYSEESSTPPNQTFSEPSAANPNFSNELTVLKVLKVPLHTLGGDTPSPSVAPNQSQSSNGTASPRKMRRVTI